MDLASKNPTGGPNCDARHDARNDGEPDVRLVADVELECQRQIGLESDRDDWRA